MKIAFIFRFAGTVITACNRNRTEVEVNAELTDTFPVVMPIYTVAWE